jgi:hypothetical protein
LVKKNNPEDDEITRNIDKENAIKDFKKMINEKR